jgi:hypothetical protein
VRNAFRWPFMTGGATHIDDRQGGDEFATASCDFPAVGPITKIYIGDQAVEPVLLRLQNREGFVPTDSYLEFKSTLAEGVLDNRANGVIIFHEEKQCSGVHMMSRPNATRDVERETRRRRNSSGERNVFRLPMARKLLTGAEQLVARPRVVSDTVQSHDSSAACGLPIRVKRQIKGAARIELSLETRT